MPRLGPECGIFAPQLALPKAGQSSGYEHLNLHIQNMATASPSVEIIPECLSAAESESHRLDSLKEVRAMIRQAQSRLGFLHQQERALLARQEFQLVPNTPLPAVEVTTQAKAG